MCTLVLALLVLSSARMHTTHLELSCCAVTDVILTCCKQDIALRLRGHRENAQSSNRGNFLQILSLVSRYVSVVDDRLSNGPRNAQYTSHNIQNTIINIMGRLLRQKIALVALVALAYNTTVWASPYGLIAFLSVTYFIYIIYI